MPTFEYQAQGVDGKVVNGQAFGSSMDQVLRDLNGKGMQIQRIGLASNPHDPLAAVAAPVPQAAPIREVSRSETSSVEESEYEGRTVPEGPADLGPATEQRTYMETSVWGPLVGQVPLSALVFFFRQGATMFEAGVPMVQALETLSGQTTSGKMSEIIRELAGHVKAGRPISAGMQRYPEVFSGIVISLIRAGEEGGFLAEGMGMVADYLEREMELRNLYKKVTFYPKLQVIVSMIIIVAANVAIDFFGGTERLQSPLTTWTTWIWLGPLLIGAFLFFRVGLANPQIKYEWDRFMTKVPYIGHTMRQLNMAKFGRAFGALYKGGVPMQKALTLSADACGNEFLRTRMYGAYRGLESGQGVTETLRNTQAFSPIVLDMVNTGETTGNLDQMLNKVADFYEDEAATRATKTGMITGVVLGLLVAMYIGYIVISFYMSHYGALGAAASEG